VHVSRCYARGQPRQDQSGLAGKQRAVEQAIAYLERNSARGVSVPDLARNVFLSTSRLQHLFKESTGMSLLEYLLQLRIDHACQLLRDTRSSIAHVAGAVGFHDRAYFARQFRKKTGVTPLQYRTRTH
jgi:transcriptional regulator GlxA family with amidase domain